MGDAISKDRLNIRTVVRLGPARNWPVLSRGSSGLADPKHIGPLLDLFVKVLSVQGRVSCAVPELHLGACAGVAGVPRASEVSPLLAGLDNLTVGACTVPHAITGKTAIRNASKGSTATNQVGVSTREDISHHGARRSTRSKDFGGVDAKLGDEVS